MKLLLENLPPSLAPQRETLRRLSHELAARDAALAAEIRPLCLALVEAYMADRYVGFDLEDPDWPALRAQFEAATALAATIRARLAA